MVFSSTVFLFLFLPIVFVVQLVLPGRGAKNAWLILASLVFYAYGDPLAVSLMLLSALGNYLLAWAMGPAGGGAAGRRKALAVAAVVLNLGTLFTFKYLGFFAEILGSVTGLPIPVPALRLPVGISFFTFQALSYVLDVYSGTCAAQKNFAKVLLYISFFPQLIAGPIVKYHDIEAQIDTRVITAQGCALGLQRFVMGLAKKLLISNAMAAVADAVFALDPAAVSAPLAWLGGISYTLQIYFDFSGYSDMAIGLGRMFGFTFLENFNYPLSASSMREFWRRWHISLTGWFREYLYIPLGGNRKGARRKALNTMIVFAFTGLWHGANFTFVLWGVFNGLFLLAEDAAAKNNPNRRPHGVPGHLYTFVVTVVLFTMFRADTVGQGVALWGRMVAGWGADAAANALALSFLTPLFLAKLALALVLCGPTAPALWRRIPQKAQPPLACLGALALLGVCILNLSSASYNPFIYFRF